MKKSKKYLLPLLILFVIGVFINDSTVYADKGDFYDRNKTQINEIKDVVGWSDDFVDLLKDYDMETNSFDCRWFSFYCKINGWWYTNVLGFVKSVYNTAEGAVIAPSDITGSSIFNKYKNGLKVLSTWMLAIFLMWQIVRIIALRFADSEDGMVALNEKILKIIALAILLGIYEPLFNFIMDFQYNSVSAVLSDSIDQDQVALSVFAFGGGYGIIFGLLIALISFIFKIAFAYRFVLFALLYIVGVVAIPTGVNDEYNYFSVWLRLLIANGVTLFLQALTFALGYTMIFSIDALYDNMGFYTGFAFFILALAVPSLLGQLGASSGTTRAMGSLIRYARRMR